MDYRDVYAAWLGNEYFDEATRLELQGIAQDEKEIEERFYKDLDFGTGGLRGVIGAGTNRMNIYTVRKATQGLAAYIRKDGATTAAKGVAIAYDSRRFSREFAEAAALVLCGNGIKTYIFEDIRPTPELSFAVRHLGCAAGIVVTASHNPPEYNGYKVYWEDGGQVQYPRDQAIIDEVNAVTDFASIPAMDKETAVSKGLLHYIGREVDDAFMACVHAQSLNGELVKEMTDNFTIVYTPLNGAGSVPVRRALREAGFTRVFTVPEQEMPDPNFSTVGYPNPEDPKAFAYAVRLGKEKGADVIIATDPDSDRVAVAVPKDGAVVYLSGNVVGVLLTEYILSRQKALGRLPGNAAIISTIVSTKMTAAVCAAYNASYSEVLTGFKYIGERMGGLEAKGQRVVIGFEESIGYLIGGHARDKDAVTASMLICEMAAAYKKRGMDLCDGLNELYETYGHYREQTRSIAFPGLSGVSDMRRLMTKLRENPLSGVTGIPVVEYRDYLLQTVKAPGVPDTSTGLPQSDVLFYTLADGSWFCVRPSGTEPKIKIYCGVRKTEGNAADAAVTGLLDGIIGMIGLN